MGTNHEGVYRPQLKGMPDGRRAELPIFEPVFFAYAALMLGSIPAALCAAYNGVLLRRVELVVAALALGGVGTFAFLVLLGMLTAMGVDNGMVLIFLGRIVHVIFGIVMTAHQRRHVLGHRFLDGKLIPLIAAVLGAFALTMVLPFPIQLLLMGIPPVGG